MRFLRAVGALAALTLAVVGTPIALWTWGVSPAVLLQWSLPDDGRALLGGFTLLGWSSWLVMLTSILAETINLTFRRRLVRLPGVLSSVQTVAGVLLVTVLAILVVAPAPAAQAADRVSSARADGPAVAVASVPLITATAEPTVAVDAGWHYEVQPGDDLWGVSETLLGDGRAWRQLTEANPELQSSPTRDLVPGTRLRLPASLPHDPPARQPHRITVTRGDTLGKLAEEYLGRAARWPELYAANRERIDDPDLIKVGWRLVVPARADAPAPRPRVDRPVRKASPQPYVPPRVPVTNPEAPPPAGDSTLLPTPVGSATGSMEMAADPVVPLVGGVGGLAAAMMLSGIAVRRQAQLRARRLGQRVAQPEEGLHRYETALGRRGRPELGTVLERVLRHLGDHFDATGGSAPPLARVSVGERGVRFDWSEPAALPPAPFEGDQDSWRIDRDSAEGLATSSHPVPYPALVTLGCGADGDTVLLDLEQRGTLAVIARNPEWRESVLAAWVVELSCSPWAEELTLAVIGLDERFVGSACSDRVTVSGDPLAALAAIVETARIRGRAFPVEADFRRARVDVDQGEAANAHVLVIAQPLTEAHQEQLRLLRRPTRGVAVVLGESPEAGSTWVVEPGTTGLRGVLRPDGVTLSAQEIPRHTRQAVASLARSADSPHQSPAPWWFKQEDNVHVLNPRTQPAERPQQPTEWGQHPELRIIGPVELVGAAGVDPSRARRQCEEYCGWLLENPGRTATQMASELLVAEGTRRSNMSRLRTWLGTSASGEPYLPEAYSGRISLDPRVTSDWQRLQVLVAPGLNRLSIDTLREVLGLVRGAPLADAAPGQWHWAEMLRTDISSVIRDAGVVLARKARATGDVDLARWATAKALLAAPEDELLLCERIRAEHRAGNRPEVERLVFRLTRHARSIGVELAPETVVLCQEAIEGRPRARA